MLQDLPFLGQEDRPPTADEMAEMRSLVPRTMDSAVALKVPVKVDTKAGANWGEMKEIELR